MKKAIYALIAMIAPASLPAPQAQAGAIMDAFRQDVLSPENAKSMAREYLAEHGCTIDTSAVSEEEVVEEFAKLFAHLGGVGEATELDARIIRHVRCEH